VVDDHDVARQLVCLLEVLRREQHVGTVGHQVADRRPQVHAATRVEPGRRLVEQQELRTADEAGAEVETATHTAGVGAHEAVAGVGEIQALEHLRGGGAGVVPIESEEPSHHPQVLDPGHRGLDRRVLPGETDDLAHSLGLGGGVDTGNADLATVRAQQCGDRAHEGRLACAVRPEERGDLARLGDQVEAVECTNVAEALRETVRLDDGCHAGLLSNWVGVQTALRRRIQLPDHLTHQLPPL
jgi:hypothetical protein